MYDRTPPSGEKAGFNTRVFLTFLVPSLIGVLMFLTPVTYDGNDTIAIAVLVDLLRSSLEPLLMEILLAVIALSALGSAYYILKKPDWADSQPSLHAMCHSTPLWFLLRLLGLVYGLCVYFEVGPAPIWAAETGQAIFHDIGIPVLFTLTTACFFIPFLTDYGFMEFVGGLVKKPFGFLFNLPGRSAIDATASFVAASTVGLLITIKQYENGFYSARESAAVAANFSVVSIPFALVVAGVAGLEHMFFTWYMVVIAACLVCAMISIRIPPLSRIPDSYFPGVGKKIHEDDEVSGSVLSRSVHDAMSCASTAPGPRKFIKTAWLSSLVVVFGVMAPAMALATTAAMLVFYTPLFDLISLPIVYVLEIFNIPEATSAAPGFLVGFFDQFLPALLAKGIESEITRFILAGLSVCQLIYMAEVGVLILYSSLPLNFWQLLAIFLIRTIIVFPVFLIAGWLIF